MSNRQTEMPLTEAARQALDSLTDEYRQRILEEADSRSVRIGGIQPEISVRDIIESAEKVGSSRSAGRERKREFILQIYSMMGVVLAMVGLSLMIKGEFLFQLDKTQQIAIITMTVGAVIALFPFFFRRIFNLADVARSTRDISPIDATSVFVSRWQTIEALLRRHLEKRGHNAAREPFSSLVSTLQERGLLSDRDILTLKQLLSLRNQVVHESGYADKRMLERAIEISGELINKLQAIEEV